MNDLNIINGTLVRKEGCLRADLAVNDGVITQIGAPGELGTASETLDASGKLVFPGMIDTHVHIRGGALDYREDFFSGTVAAASGGVTTFLEMPVGKPPACTAEDFESRRREMEELCAVDFCMYAGAGEDNIDQIQRLASLGAIGYKTFLMPPVPGREKEFYGLCCESEEALIAVMERVKTTGLPIVCHSELNEYVAEPTCRMMASGRNDLEAFCESRPDVAELEAVKRVIRSAEKTGCKASICHVSLPETVDLIAGGKAKGVDIHGETCPQYLVYNYENAGFAGPFARMKPPLRSPETSRRLLADYGAGRLEITGSDHAPYTYAEKTRNGDDIWHSFDGIPGLELSLRLLLTKVEEGELSYEALAANTAENPAAFFGIDDRKGRLEAGRDADLVILERLNEPEIIDLSRLFTKSSESGVLYSRTRLTHRVVRTLVRGQTVFADGQFTGSKGFGHMIKPENKII